MGTESQIFNAARKLSGHDRSAYLDQACGGDTELRNRVEGLLAAGANLDITNESAPMADRDPDATRDSGSENEKSSFENEPAATIDSSFQSERDESVDGLVAGNWIGLYELLEPLGEGGMGEVWMAEQYEPVKRRVALKVIKAGISSKQILARFEAERQALALMNHPNIARILDAGTTPDGQPFFAMELVKGDPLTKYCDANKLSISDRLQLFSDVCSGVQHAHQKGIIHRDLKPSNILVSTAEGKPAPKVIDFGLAKALESTQRLTDKSLFTGIGQILGTLKYMSPEQASLENVDIDTRTDIYSLGVILYELLTGTAPLDEKSLKGEAVLKLLELIREKDPVKPSSRLSNTDQDSLSQIIGKRKTDVARLGRVLSGDLDWVVMKALEKDRTRRYESASGLASDIGRYLNGEPVVARPPSVSYRTRKFIRKHSGLVASSAAVLVLLLVGIAGTSWGLRWALQERAIAVESEENEKVARDEAEDARGEAEGARGEAEVARDKAEVALDTAERAAYFGAIQMSAVDVKLNDYRRLAATLTEQPPEYRGWEWGYLATATRQPETIGPNFRGGGGVALSPSGDSILVVRGKDLALHSYPERKLIWKSTAVTPNGRPRPQFIAGGKLIALIVGKQAIGILNAQTGKLVKQIESLNAHVICAHPSKPWLYIGNDDGELLVVSMKNWEVLQKRKVGFGRSRCLTVSPDGKLVAMFCLGHETKTANFDGKLRTSKPRQNYLLDAISLEVFHEIPVFSSNGTMALAILESQVLLEANGTMVSLYSLSDGKFLGRRLVGDNQDIKAIAVSPDGKLIVTGGVSGTINVYEAKRLGPDRQSLDIVETKTSEPTSKNLIQPDSSRYAQGEIQDIICLPSGGVAATAKKKPLQIWPSVELPTLRPPVVLAQTNTRGTYHVEYRDDGALVLASGWWVNDEVLVYSPGEQTRQRVRLEGLGGVEYDFKFVHFRPGGKEIAAHTADALCFYDSSQGTKSDAYPLLRKIALAGPLNDFVFSPTGKFVALAYQGGGVDVVDAMTGKRSSTMAVHSDANPMRVEFNLDESLVAIHEKYLRKQELVICRVHDGAVRFRFPTTLQWHNHFDFAFHPSKPLLAVGEQDGRIVFYDSNHGYEVKTLKVEGTNTVGSLRFNADGSRLLTGDRRLIRIWDWQLGKTLFSIPMRYYVMSARFSPDGRSLAANTITGMQIWEAEPYAGDAKKTTTTTTIQLDLAGLRSNFDQVARQLGEGKLDKAWDALRKADELIAKTDAKSSENHNTFLTARMVAVANACEENGDWALAEKIWSKVLARRESDEKKVLYRATALSLANACDQQSKEFTTPVKEVPSVVDDFESFTIKTNNFAYGRFSTDLENEGFIPVSVMVTAIKNRHGFRLTWAKNRPQKYSSWKFIEKCSPDEFEQLKSSNKALGMRLVQHNTFMLDEKLWHIALWLKESGDK